MAITASESQLLEFFGIVDQPTTERIWTDCIATFDVADREMRLTCLISTIQRQFDAQIEFAGRVVSSVSFAADQS